MNLPRTPLITSFLALWTTLSLANSSQAWGHNLSLGDYLQQVAAKNGTYQSALAAGQGHLLRSVEGEDLFAPTLIMSGLLTSDGRTTNNTQFQGTKTQFNSYSLGISQNTKFGTKARLTYNLNYTEITGVNSLYVPNNKFHDAFPKIELSQSLWSNGFGAAFRAQRDLSQEGALVSHYMELFKSKAELLNAELAYWRLAAARRTVLVRLGTLKRAEAIREWSDRRAKLLLTDQSDLLQAEAALKIRRLEHIAAQDEERSAARAFNTARGQNSDEVNEELSDLNETDLLALSMPTKGDARDDTKAAEHQVALAAAQSRLDHEKTAPVLDLTGSYAHNARRVVSSEAMANSFNAEHPQWSLGMNFSLPLDFSVRSQIREGRQKELIAAEGQLDRKRFEEQRTWDDLAKKYKEIRSRLELAVAIVEAQKEKLNFEKARLGRGRTTTYQVLIFEQDYAQSQLSLIQTKSELLQTITQMKLFAEGSL